MDVAHRLMLACVIAPLAGCGSTPDVLLADGRSGELPPASGAAGDHGADGEVSGDRSLDGPRRHLWLKSEYLMWSVKDGPAPITVATLAPPDSTQRIPGAEGNPDTMPVLGGRDLDYPAFHGGRFTLGVWLDEDESLAVEGGYFFLREEDTARSVASNGGTQDPFLTNPFLEVGTRFAPGPIPVDSTNFLAFPGSDLGHARLESSSRLQGAEGNLVVGTLSGSGARLSLLGGFRFLELREDLALNTAQIHRADDGFAFPGEFVHTLDRFETTNRFYGGQVGARIDYELGPFYLEATGKVALGNVHEVVAIRGETTTNAGTPFLSERTGLATVLSGIYAQPTNIGDHTRNRFAAAPQVDVEVGVKLFGNVRLFAGYSFLFVTEVVRPGRQMDRKINSTQLASFTGLPAGPLDGEPAPRHRFDSSEFYAHGLTIGLTIEW